jgi:hypothetical protein
MKLVALFAIALLALLPLSLAENSSDDYGPDGYTNTILSGLGQNTTSDDLFGGGGSPLTPITDPIIDSINEATGSNWGFLIFYSVVFLISSLILVPLVGGLIFSYIGYLLGTYFDLPFTFWLMIVMGIIGTFIMWKATHKSNRLGMIRKLVMALLVIVIIAVLAMVVLNFLKIDVKLW